MAAHICKIGGLRKHGVNRSSLENLPVVTIITVVYNGEKFLEETIKSVINQTYSNIEYIIIDGRSNDRTLEIISKYDDHIDFWISEEDKGIYDAMNKGLKFATGKLIGILNSDDWYMSNTIEKVVDVYLKSDKSSIIHGILKIWTNTLFFGVHGRSDLFFPEQFPPHPTCFVPRRVYEMIGNFDIQFRSAADYDFLIRCKLGGVGFIFIESVLTNFRSGGCSTRRFTSETEKIQHKYGYRTNFSYRMKILFVFIKNCFMKRNGF